jgi:hypothetical protein
MKIIIPITQQTDRCGNEFLDENHLELIVTLFPDSEYVYFDIPGILTDCQITKSDLCDLGRLLK